MTKQCNGVSYTGKFGQECAMFLPTVILRLYTITRTTPENNMIHCYNSPSLRLADAPRHPHLTRRSPAAKQTTTPSATDR